jgi:cytochrome P450
VDEMTASNKGSDLALERSTAPAVAPKRWPLLGHVPALIRSPVSFIQSLNEIDDDIVVMYLGRKPAYLVTNPQLVRHMLVVDPESFVKGLHYQKLAGLLGNSLATVSGPAHRSRRRLMQPAFHRARIHQHARAMREAADEFIRDWRPGDIIPIDEAMRALALTIVTRALFSAEISADMMATVQRDLPLVMHGVAWRVLLPSRTIERLPLPANKRFREANDRLRQVVAALVARDDTDTAGRHDFLSLLLESHDPETGFKLDSARIQDELVNFMFAGAETTGNAMAWLWHMLSAEPEIEWRLHAESCKGVSEFTERVVLETLRLYPPAWIVSRQAIRPAQLGQYIIPPGAHVLFSPFGVQRDSRNYSDPLTFDPDRWLPGQLGQSRRPYLPFGAGPHNCIGQGFAMLEMVTVVAAIARRYRLVPLSRTSFGRSAALAPDELRMRVEPYSD